MLCAFVERGGMEELGDRAGPGRFAGACPGSWQGRESLSPKSRMWGTAGSDWLGALVQTCDRD